MLSAHDLLTQFDTSTSRRTALLATRSSQPPLSAACLHLVFDGMFMTLARLTIISKLTALICRSLRDVLIKAR